MPAPKPEYTGFRRILHSYRWRRRFVVWSIIVCVLGALVGIAVVSVHNPSSAPHGGKATIVVQPKKAPFERAEQRQVHKVLARFLSTAVARRHVATAWSIAGPELRSGLSKRQWDSGAIPVQPYPVANKGLGEWESVEYSYKNAVGLSVLLFPKPGTGQAPVTADVDVVKGRHGRWLVNYFMPNKYHGNLRVAPKHKAAAHPQKRLSRKTRRSHAATHSRAAAAPATPAPPHANRLYWAIPVGLLALAVFIPLSAFSFVWIRNKRAYNRYARRRT